MWPCEYAEQHFFELPDDPIPTLLVDEKMGIVCTGVGLDPTGTKASRQSESVARKAIDLCKQYFPYSIVISTAGYRYRGKPLTEAEAMRRIVLNYFSFEKTFEIEDVDNTHQEVQRAIEILQEQGCSKAIIIGQQLHLTRIRALFKKIGADSGIQFFFVKARSPYGGNSQWRFCCFPFFLFWEKALCFPYLKWKGIL